MSFYIGFDTSNYTSSAAAYFPNGDKLVYKKRLLRVKDGEIGLRQNEAVFQHTMALPELLSELFGEFRAFNENTARSNIRAFSSSLNPRDEEGSYMPCFLVGDGIAASAATVLNVPHYRNSHQANHIIAALYSAGRLDLAGESFVAFHVSGGTTEALLVSPDSEKIISTKIIAASLDLNAGQVIDRVGAALGLSFPAGAALDALARESEASFKISPALKGKNCCLSGLENICMTMLAQGSQAQDIAKYCIDYISQTLYLMVKGIISEYGILPLVFSGGVMSNTMIKERFMREFGAVFAAAELSADNAAGTAILGYLKEKLKTKDLTAPQ